VAGQEVETREIEVPVVLPEPPDSLMFKKPPPESVQVRVRSTGRRLFWFRIQPPRLSLPVRMQASAEPDTINLNRDYLTLPRAFEGEIDRFEPPFVTLQLVEVYEKRVPVKAQVDREPRLPLAVDKGSLKVEPAYVSVRGPRDKVASMPWVRTDVLDLQEETESGEKKLGLLSEDPQIRFTPNEVTVRYTISHGDSGSVRPDP